jgi:transcriptional regulator with XRE-family HTH domain
VLPMEPLTKLGEALATLRGMLGYSVEEAAAKSGLSVEEFKAAEQGQVPPDVRPQLARLFSLDAEQLAVGLAIPSETNQADTATIYLFHDGTQDFAPADWQILAEAMRWARVYVTKTKAGRDGLKRRLEFAPIPPAGPQARDAAHQGYQLARLARKKLGLEQRPIGNIRALMERSLGAPVLVNSFSTTDLRAASILDVQRVSAATVLSSHDPLRAANPNLVRVYLAHEICHILFDPGRPGCVQIALENNPGHPAPRASLLESRARGFAAEFLLPDAGLRVHLGPPTNEGSLQKAVDLVNRATARFRTPRRIAAWHLGNLGFITNEIASELPQYPGKKSSAVTTSLPPKGKPPLCIPKHLGLDPKGAMAASAVAQSRTLARSVLVDSASELAERAYQLIDSEQPRTATDLLMSRIDALLTGNEMTQVVEILVTLDPVRTPPMVLTPLLSLTRHAKGPLGDARVQFFNRAMKALESTWKLSEERLKGIRESQQ